MAVLLSSPGEVKALVPDIIFKRAKEVVSANKLHDVVFEGPSLHKSSATCTGSNPGDTYNLNISISAETSSNPICQCSCPAAPKAKGNFCKHVIALLLMRSQKVAKDQANEAILSEFKLAEDRLVEDRYREPTLSDSQATEVFVPLDSKVDNDTTTTASISPEDKNKQRRVLPSWIPTGYSEKTEIRVKRGYRKAVSKLDGIDSNVTLQSGRPEGKGRLDKGANKSSIAKRRTNVEAEIVQDLDAVEKSLDGHEQKQSSRAGRGSTQSKCATAVKMNAPASKRRRTRAYVESDLSKEEQPEVFDEYYSFEAKGDLVLTTEDLVNLATKHLETAKSNVVPEQCKPDESTGNDEPEDVVKKMGSIFSVQGWQEVASRKLDSNGTSFSQEVSVRPQLPLTFVGDYYTSNSQASADLSSDLPIACGDTKGLASVRTAENVVDDMLGLFFGPTLSRAINNKSECSQITLQDVNSIIPASAESDMLEVIHPLSNNSLPQPKKKSSLKDKAMMYLN